MNVAIQILRIVIMTMSIVVLATTARFDVATYLVALAIFCNDVNRG